MVHAIVEQMEPSAEQRPAITWTGGDLLVTAGAGSGKTRTLVARYLSLLAEGLPLRSIVAVTFTRKAAQEMRNRVRLQVQRYLGRADLPGPGNVAEEERQRWLEVYGALDAARIGTIHSLCSEVLRAHPAEAGIDPRFEMLDEAQTGLLTQQAIDEGMAWASSAPEVRELYTLLGERDLRTVAETMLNKRLDVGPILASGVSPWPRWQETCLPPLVNFLDNGEVQTAFAELVALRGSGALARAEAAADELAPVVEQLCEAWDMLVTARREGDWEAASGWLSSLDGLLKQKGKKGNWAPANPKDTIKTLRGLYEDVPAWLRKGDLALDRQLAEAMPALARLYAVVEKNYKELKDERNALDFDDLEDRAVALLNGHVEVLARWREDVQAILVDEFQDTNRRQLALVDLLNGGRGRATFVGDDKQSIYRFRGAEVGLFRDLKRRCVEQNATDGSQTAALNLQASYRAHRELLAGLNTLLRSALGVQADADLQERRKGPEPGWVSPYIELHMTVGTRGEGKALERAACALAARLKELLAGGRMVRVGDALRPLGYGDMAILCRASRSFSAYEDALDQAGIPFTTVAGRGFYQRPEVRDLMNAMRAVSEPNDDLAVAGLLRSPALGLSDATLYSLCCRREKGSGLWQALQGTMSSIDGAERERAQRAVALITELHRDVGRAPVADLLKTLIDASHYRAALRRAGQGRAVRNVDKLLADAHASGMVSVGEFLEYVALLRDAGTREGEARATSEGAVQIMSVHAAKGLEFPVVVLGDIGAEKGSRTKVLIDAGWGVLLPLQAKNEAGDGAGQGESASVVGGRDEAQVKRCAPCRGKWPATYLRATEQEDEQEREESARLLYVAATRARDMLLINGCMRLGKDNRPAGLGEWLDWLAAPLDLGQREFAHSETGRSIIRVALLAGATPVACCVYEPECSWEHGDVAEPEMETSAVGDLRLLDPGSLPGEGAQDTREAAELAPRVWQVMPGKGSVHAPSWLVGQLVHESLSAWRFPDARFEAWAEARARTLGLIDAHMLRDAAIRSATLLRRFRGHALYQEMNAAERRAEVPYSLRGGDGSTDHGVIDALYRRDGQWTIVEFKTDHVSDAAQETLIVEQKGYRKQAERYIRAVEELLGEKPRHIFCWLDYAGKVECEPRAGRE